LRAEILSNFNEIKYGLNTNMSATTCNKFVFGGNMMYLFRKKLLNRIAIK